MPINRNYKGLLCYKHLTPEHRKCVDGLIEKYGEDLNSLTRSGDFLFTLHDFNHHCYNLYRVISRSLCNLEIEQGDGENLTEHELFLLVLAVLFHDSGMSSITNITVYREQHSLISAQYLRDEWDNHASRLYEEGQKVNLSINDINAVAEIIKAHSDVKGADSPSKTGIYAESLRDKMPSSSSRDVRAKLLAGILRLADELDITSDRLGDIRLARQLDPQNPGNKTSIQHWEALGYFSQVCIDEQYATRLNLVVDDNAVYQKIQSGDEDSVLVAIKRVSQKILSEFSDIDQEIFQKTSGSRKIIRISSIQVTSRLVAVNKLGSALMPAQPQEDSLVVDDKNSVIRLQSNSKAADQEEDTGSQSCTSPMVISAETQNTLDNFIIRKKLVEPGHYLMNERFCARDWVNTLSILEDQVLFEKCIQEIARHIRQKQPPDNTVILGLDLNGTLLGVRIAAALQRPFAFLIPARKVSSTGRPDNIIDISAFDKAICITDAIVTGSTLNELIIRHKLQDKILGIYTLLYRRPIGAVVDTELELLHPVYCISNTFNIEVAKKSDCSWIATIGCMASNKVVK